MPHRQHRNANAADRRGRLRRRAKRGSDWVSGTLVELDADRMRLKIRVDSARRPHFRRETEFVVEAADAVFRAADGDGDGRAGVTDLFPGDRLHVELAPHTEDSPATALRVTQRSPGGPVGGLRRLWPARNG